MTLSEGLLFFYEVGIQYCPPTIFWRKNILALYHFSSVKVRGTRVSVLFVEERSLGASHLGFWCKEQNLGLGCSP